MSFLPVASLLFHEGRSSCTDCRSGLPGLDTLGACGNAVHLKHLVADIHHTNECRVKGRNWGVPNGYERRFLTSRADDYLGPDCR